MMNQNLVYYNNQIQQLMQQQLMQMQQVMQQQQMNQEMPYVPNPQAIPKEENICVYFRRDRKETITVLCTLSDKISELIKRYRNISLDNSDKNLKYKTT